MANSALEPEVAGPERRAQAGPGTSAPGARHAASAPPPIHGARRYRRQPRRPAAPAAMFAVSGLAALLAAGLAVTLVLREAGAEQAMGNARQLTRMLATGAVEPNLSDRLLAGHPAAVERLDRAMRQRELRAAAERVRLRSRDGRVLYSDEPRLIGSKHPLEEDQLRGMRTRAVAAEVAGLPRTPDRSERSGGEILEVSVPVRTPSGKPLLFEAYMRSESVAADRRRMWLTLTPPILAAMALAWLVQVPLARSMAGRLREGQRERQALVVKAIEAFNLERRRIAGDLHDGVVQDLAGLSFSLAAAADGLDSASTVGTREALQRATIATRESVRRLRSLLVEIYPLNVCSTGLEPALTDLLAPLGARGIAAHLEVAPDLEVRDDAERLIFRTAQEAVRNAVAHAEARSLWVQVVADGRRAIVSVRDDGRGFDATEVECRRATGHLGLALLADRARDLDGRLEVESAVGAGTCVRLEVDR